MGIKDFNITGLRIIRMYSNPWKLNSWKMMLKIEMMKSHFFNQINYILQKIHCEANLYFLSSNKVNFHLKIHFNLIPYY